MVLHRIFLFGHLLCAFLYFLAHGASVAVLFRLRREANAERVRALLDLSWSTVVSAYYMLLGTVVCGVVLGFLGHWWSARWIWVSIGTLVVVLAVMLVKVAPYFHRIRRAAGLEFVGGTWQRTSAEVSSDELSRLVAAVHPAAIAAFGVGGWGVIVWLMLFKPVLG